MSFNKTMLHHQSTDTHNTSCLRIVWVQLCRLKKRRGRLRSLFLKKYGIDYRLLAKPSIRDRYVYDKAKYNMIVALDKQIEKICDLAWMYLA
jgi:hypothetical protein